jgi:hypothetical protein
LQFFLLSPSPPGEEFLKGYVSSLDPLFFSLVLTCKHEEEADGKVTESGAYLIRKNKPTGPPFSSAPMTTDRQGRSKIEL